MSYYLRLILDGVGVRNPNTQGAINGGLQVSRLPYVYHERIRKLLGDHFRVQIFNLFSAMLGASLVDKLGRRTLFLISNTCMLIGKPWNTGTRKPVHAKTDLP